jgi:hypothetical protein
VRAESTEQRGFDRQMTAKLFKKFTLALSAEQTKRGHVRASEIADASKAAK